MWPFKRFRIEDRSMEPSFDHGDYVIVSRLPYLFSKPGIGDVVVVRHPVLGTSMLKRVSSVMANEYYFVEGDNSGMSVDSRHFGPVQGRHIVGKVVFHAKK